MIHRNLSIILAFMLMLGTLSSCASTQNYEAQLNAWIGKSEKELVMGWGIPDKQYQLDARTKMVSYVKRSTVVYPDTMSTCVGTFGGMAAFNGCSGLPPTVSTYACETTFVIVRGIVTRWGHQGNDCRA